ncbi:MAG: ferritin [Verrucomicrobia bacterium CG_4_10_14_3_um_filter_43_23]|nr:MAG: hypothetical protein AUJ82_08300 [Verrucomicrobia bacterium CG1_02_43_26]PIP59928.1 MAG: ferritin [Verrucomicrobia bacterium CG22_combo_CG10-13_8_21_14_all_43_17]PIX58268.1 MAG: ferritin [Verrucomicrobia bacterium CG_4_10_14_3_um_filter_43_23]PIY62454.1 MAG: ferritin [Verrucomicrobia bacterium CG_4_10_14_0_8_um_filter_43_34]PJA44460.1 MAG: ferritin [Verrucomicrobia bacterium CG_4_9_14_3_um_filter_43_20]
MKLSTKLEKLINDQTNLELTAAYIYLGMAAWFETTPYDGFSIWMRKQFNEEIGHAMRFFDFLKNRNNVIELEALAKPTCSFASPIEVFKASLTHEQKVTRSIQHIYKVAEEEDDFTTMEFLNWFLKEQVEEEKNVQDMLDKLLLAGENPDALLRIDALAGKRSS